MKPSERISEIYKIIKNEDFAEATWWKRNFCTYNRDLALTEATIKYLDEQAERREKEGAHEV